MFKTKDLSHPATPETVTSGIVVLALGLSPRKDQEQLEPWIAAGWKLTSTEAVLLQGQTSNILAFLTRG